MGESIQRLKSFLFKAESDLKEGEVLSFFLQNPALVLSLSYLFISGLGLLYETFHFRQFGINILDYSEASDFFLMALKRPEVILLLLLTVVLFASTRYVVKTSQKIENKFLRNILVFIFSFGLLRKEIQIFLGIIYFIVLYVVVAMVEARVALLHANDAATVAIKADVLVEEKVIPLGATEKFLFGLVVNDELIEFRKQKKNGTLRPHVLAIPFSNISTVRFASSELSRIGSLKRITIPIN